MVWGDTASLGSEVSLVSTWSYPDHLQFSSKNCDIRGGEAGIHSSGEVLISSWYNNIDADPCFVAPGCWNADVWSGGNYHLGSCSPCIDSGVDGTGALLGARVPSTDIEGNLRYDDKDVPNTGIPPDIIDMGAFERQFDSGSQPIISLAKCQVKAGKIDKSDSILISGKINATAEDFSNANDVLVTINSPNIVNLLIRNFPINNTTFTKGKYKYAMTENASKSLFKFDPIKGTFTFTATNVDLTGLCCPLTIEIKIGNYVGVGKADENIINGSTKPIPLQLRRRVGDFEPDGDVDFADLAVLATQWLKNYKRLSADIYPIGGDGVVNLLDFVVIAEHWLEGR
jgi:hypothetical protein